MTATLDDELADLRRENAELQRRLDERTAELSEALEQQTATSEVLGVINSSPGDLTPVFEAILDKAHSLCGATLGTLFLFDGETFRGAAIHGYPEELAHHLRRGVSGSQSAFAPLVGGVRLIHIPDLSQIDEPMARLVSGRGGVRTNLLLPLRKDGALLGMISCNRQEVRPFSDKEIALLENFAAQAVIAMENARLLGELQQRTGDLQESLEYQTATSDVLKVISRSTFDLDIALQSVVAAAHRLCRSDYSVIFRKDGNEYRWAAGYGISAEYEERERRAVIRPEPGTIIGRAILAGHAVQIADAQTDLQYEGEAERDARAMLGVPLLRDGVVIGGIGLARNRVETFTDREVELVTSFADQAAIAIENARLLTETQEALDQQTATAEVLGVINSSPGDLAPVFDAMLEKAMRLCGAVFGELRTYDGEGFQTVATRGVPDTYAEYRRQHASVGEPGGISARILEGKEVVHILDLKDEAAYQDGHRNRRALVDLGGARTALLVPLRKGETILGVIMIYRQEVRPFTDKQIALLQNFAAQAVIAMENARLIAETREALEQQTATAEVLGVINSSPGNLGPVFDAMLDKATRLSEATFGILWIYDGDRLHAAALHGVPKPLAEYLREPLRPGPGTSLARVIGGEPLIHVVDVTADEAYRAGHPGRRALADLGGARTALTCALRKDDRLLGVFTIYRNTVRPFSAKQIALLQNFAAQAVIAIENARLINETREALEQQTATAEVLQVINSSPGNLAPVFDAMLERAARLCEADAGHLFRFENGAFFRLASHGVSEDFDRVFPPETPVLLIPRSVPAQMVATRSIVHVRDAREDESYRLRLDRDMVTAVEEAGILTLLFVPLIKEGEVVGHFTMHRMEVRPFSEKQIALVQNFAAQAVIAMENARLITETQEALDQQTATAEVLQVINANPGDLQPVFDVILEKAMALCDVAYGDLELYDGDTFRAVATLGLSDAFAEQVRRGYPAGDNPATRPLVAGERISHIVNMAEADFSKVFTHAPAKDEGHHTLLCVPLRRENALLGMIACARREVRAFSDKEITLLESFAAQAVIAMENARLITETREALEQQTATAEVLQVINSSPGDLTPVFEVMVERAAHLCEADEAAVRTFDGGLLHLVTTHGTDPLALERLRRLGPTTLSGLYEPFSRGDGVVHYLDARGTDTYRNHQAGRQRIDARGIRSWLAVALRKEGSLLGIINVHRREVRPFSEKQIALLENFAAQAVIAIENARLLNEIRQRQAELRVTFDNMADGVVMFDEDLRLAAWNRNFQELLDIPDAVLVERPSYADYLRILVQRGEFGTDDIEAELSRRLEEAHQELRLERTRPDGRVIEVRRNAVPDGGFVLIYSDITERKRSEVEIRAARDAAEAAYRDLKAAQANLVQAEKMASLGQLTAGIAHEIKNPLNFVNNFAGLSVELLDELKETTAPAVAALDQSTRAEVDETMVMLTGNLEKIAEHGKRADNIVKSMLEHSRGVSGERREVDLNQLVEEALNLAYHGARAQDQSFNITLEHDYAPALKPIELAPQEITRVFLNLFGNGFYAANKRVREDSDGAFRPILTVATRDLGDAIEVRVRDNGTGIPPDIRDKLFQPFFTTKPTGEGTGLGLSISYDIVTAQHGGTITVDSRVGEFTEFTIRLPRSRRAAGTGGTA